MYLRNGGALVSAAAGAERLVALRLLLVLSGSRA
ncbi:hypothetical protein P3T39_005075 [Kitasatospora sp. GP82]|nr:hypothetical protein [Kitasatospora sp. GP82]